MQLLKIMAMPLAVAFICSCSKTPVACADLSPAATSDLVVQHLKSGFTNAESRNPLETPIKPPADFGKLLTIGTVVVETVSQAPDGNSANCAAHFEATAASQIQQSALRWKGAEDEVRAMLQLASRNTGGDEIGADGYFQFAARKLAGTVKVLKEYTEANPGPGFLPSGKFTGTVKFVLSRGEGHERKYAVTGEPIAPKWAQALSFYPALDEFMAERTRAAERKQAYGAFEVVKVKAAEMCGDEAMCIHGTPGKEFVLNAGSLGRDALQLLDTSAKAGSDVCLTGVEKTDGRLMASGVVESCQ